MARVYLVEHVITGKRRALKMLHDDLGRDPKIVERFLNEARAASALEHNNILEIIDVAQVDGNGPWYIVMAYLRGQTLARYIANQQGRPIEQRLIIEILCGPMAALGAAHDRGIVHRDLKPDNLYMASVKDDPFRTHVLDFGVAHIAKRDSKLTATGAVIGTPQYMAPEQHAGRPIDHRADIWAMAAIVYEMATGRPPFHDDGTPAGLLTAQQLFLRMNTMPLVDPRRYNPALSEAFATWTMRGLSLDPNQRPAKMRQFGVKLAEATHGTDTEESGIEIAKRRARDLLKEDEMEETIRSSGPAPGTGTASRYEIGGMLGEGGMAEVYRATARGAEGFSRTVALKRIRTENSSEPQFATMFIQEMKIASQLVHANIVSVIDFNRDEAGRFFLAMEYVNGKDLGALIDTGPLPAQIAIHVAIEMLRGLGYAHEAPIAGRTTRGVIHRDIKPQNVLVSWQGDVKVSDFGISKPLDASGTARSLLLKGTPAYMSPEQAGGETIDARSDLYAAGLVLWEMLTGRRMRDGGTAQAFAAILGGDVPSVSSVGVRIAGDLDRVVRTLLAHNRNERYRTAEEAIAALTSCRDHPRDGRSELARLLAERFARQISEPAPMLPSRGDTRSLRPPGAAPLNTTLGSAASQVSAAPAPSRRWWFAVAAAATILGGAALVAVVVTTRSVQPSHEVAPNDAALALNTNDASMPAVATDAAERVALAPPDAAPQERATQPLTMDAGVPAPDARPARSGTRVDAGVAVHRAHIRTGTLKIVILPWAEVWIDGKALDKQTPVTVELAAGTHRVRLKNDSREKTVTVRISPGKTFVIEETW